MIGFNLLFLFRLKIFLIFMQNNILKQVFVFIFNRIKVIIDGYCLGLKNFILKLENFFQTIKTTYTDTYIHLCIPRSQAGSKLLSMFKT
jgi:hypothetical protein